MGTESDKVNVGAIATLVAVGTILLVALVAFLTALVRQEVGQDQQRKGGLINDRPVRDLVAAQQAELTQEAKWVDRSKGVLSIPIDRAMHLVTAELRENPELATMPSPDAGTPEALADAGSPEAGTPVAPAAGPPPSAASALTLPPGSARP